MFGSVFSSAAPVLGSIVVELQTSRQLGEWAWSSSQLWRKSHMASAWLRSSLSTVITKSFLRNGGPGWLDKAPWIRRATLGRGVGCAPRAVTYLRRAG
jgi:hypothetical protein